MTTLNRKDALRGEAINARISINTLCFADAPLSSLVEIVAELGAQAISPEISQVAAISALAAERALRGAGLTVATLTHRAFAFADPGLVESGRESLGRTLEVAAAIGAKSVTMTTGGRGKLSWPSAADGFIDAIAPLAERARGYGVRLAIEPTSHLYTDASIAHRLADCTALASAAGIDVTLDLFACWFDSDIMAAIADAGTRIAVVQLSDYIAGDRALPCRAVPGDGTVPLGELVSAIERTGYAGYYDLEIIGPRLAAAR
jgi:sugar phosphate isomerase/epimerase